MLIFTVKRRAKWRLIVIEKDKIVSDIIYNSEGEIKVKMPSFILDCIEDIKDVQVVNL